MKLFSILLSLIAVIGNIKIFGLSLFDEILFLLLFLLLANFKYSNKIVLTDTLPINKYYLRASFSYKLLFIYLIFSLFIGLQIDLYFGKIRWLIILFALLFYDYFAYIYQKNKLQYFQNLPHLRTLYFTVFNFSIFYLVYALFAKLFFDISPDLLQAAEVEAWYAIWNTTAYVAIIFLILLFYNKALRANGLISKYRFFAAYFLTALIALYFDTRTAAVILLIFIIVEFLKMKFFSKIFFGLLAVPIFVIIAIVAESFIDDFISSGGFLLTLVDGSNAEENLRDFDRVAHYIATYDFLNSSSTNALFGSGFLNAGTIIKDYYSNVYYQFGLNPGIGGRNIAGNLRVGTFGLSAFLIENGLIGFFLLLYHVYNLIRAATTSNLLISPIYIIIIYPLLFLLFFSIYLNDNIIFYLLFSPATIIYPLINSNNNKLS